MFELPNYSLNCNIDSNSKLTFTINSHLTNSKQSLNGYLSFLKDRNAYAIKVNMHKNHKILLDLGLNHLSW